MSHKTYFVAALVAVMTACGGSQANHPTVPPPGTQPSSSEAMIAPPPKPEEAPAPTLRLPADLARPAHYALDLTIVPTSDTFAGKLDLELELLKSTDVLWLNAKELTVSAATVDGAKVDAKIANDDVIGFHFPQAHAAGKITLHVEYTGKISPKDEAGLFSEKQADQTYAYTQFENTYARRALPCFDEPGWKAPMQLTLHVKKEHVAVSNTPGVESDEANGMKMVKFAETRPLPTYLYAWAVGPFDVVEAGKTKAGVPVRVIVPHGSADQTDYAGKTEIAVLDHLAAYFDIPFAYPKMDVVAVPNFFGAMENAGMITYAQTSILTRKAEETPYFDRAAASIIAHETSHQWFGDLVTTAWWDDIWLNEAFAEWSTYRVLDEIHPEWGEWQMMYGERAGALHGDALPAARQVRQPINTPDDIENAFDEITYGKGSAVIRMFELWEGPEAFQKGIHAYLTKHADGNATASDFLGAQGEASGRDVKTPFSTFLDQPGVPSIDVTLTCAAGAPPKVTLAQSRLVTAGAQVPDGTWQTPVCVRWGAGPADRACTLLTQKTQDLTLMAKTCPDFLVANADGAGYYVPVYQGDLLQRLVGKSWSKLNPAEQDSMVYEIGMGLQENKVKIGDVLPGIPSMATTTNLPALREVAGMVAGLSDGNILPEESRPAYIRFVNKLFGAKAHALGFVPKKGEDDETRMTRPAIVGLVADMGQDKDLVAQASELAKKWMADHSAVSPDMVGIVLRVASLHGDKTWWDALHAALATAKDPKDRERLEGALSSFLDPVLAKQTLALSISDEIDVRESMQMVMGGLGDYRTRQQTYDFVNTSFDAILKRLPSAFGEYILYIGAGFCDGDKKAQYDKDYTARAKLLNGGPHIFQEVEQMIDTCSAVRAQEAPEIAAFFKKY